MGLHLIFSTMRLLSHLSNPPAFSGRQFLAKHSTANESCPLSCWLLAINSWPQLIIRFNYTLIICQDGVGASSRYSWSWVCTAQICLSEKHVYRRPFSYCMWGMREVVRMTLLAYLSLGVALYPLRDRHCWEFYIWAEVWNLFNSLCT